MKVLNSCISLIFLSVIILFTGACGISEQSSGSTGSLAFGLVWKEPSAASSENLISAIPGDCSGVETVRVAVYDDGGTLLRSEDFPCSDHQGTVGKIPVGLRMVVIYGLVNNEILYWAQVPDVTIREGKTADLGTVDVDYAVPVANAIVGYREVKISWTDVAGATSYKIYLSESIGGEKTDSISDVTSPYTHTELLNPTAYYYVVTAVNSYGESAVSAEVPCPRFAYVANSGEDNNVSVYTINSTTGVLAEISNSPFPAGTQPVSVTVDPSGKFAYVANYNLPYGISMYTINSTTGALAEISNLPFPAGTRPRSVTVDPSGRFAYVANAGSNSVSVYTIDDNGNLAPQIPPTIAAGTSPRSVAVDPSGRFAYVANSGEDNNVSVYTIDDNGNLAPQIPPTIAAGTSPRSVAVDPSGKFAYVANADSNSVSVYTIDPDNGNLAPQITEPTVAAGTFPWLVVVDPSGRFVYVANAGFDSVPGSVSGYTIDSTGELDEIEGSPFTKGVSSPHSVAVDPSGRFVYVTNAGGSDSVSVYTIDNTINGTGALTLVQTVDAGTSPWSVTTTGMIQ